MSCGGSRKKGGNPPQKAKRNDDSHSEPFSSCYILVPLSFHVLTAAIGLSVFSISFASLQCRRHEKHDAVSNPEMSASQVDALSDVPEAQSQGKQARTSGDGLKCKLREARLRERHGFSTRRRSPPKDGKSFLKRAPSAHCSLRNAMAMFSIVLC